MPHKPLTHSQRMNQGRRLADQQYERKRMSDPVLRRAKNIRNSHRYQRFRAWFKRRHPLCCDPFWHHAENGVAVPTAQVHHIIPLTTDEGVRLAFVESSNAPVCVPCHAKVEALERAGKPTRHLFASFVQTVSGDQP